MFGLACRVGVLVPLAWPQMSVLDSAAFEHAREPKRLIVLPGGHFDAYVAGFAAASGPARDWFVRHLAP